MSAADAAEFRGVSQTHWKKIRTQGVSSSKGELNGKILFLTENQHSQTDVFNFSWPRGRLTRSKANSEPWKSRNHDTMVWERKWRGTQEESGVLACQFKAYGKLIIPPSVELLRALSQWSCFIMMCDEEDKLHAPVSQVITNPHSIPGKHVTKWVKITTRTSQSSFICSESGLWGQGQCSDIDNYICWLWWIQKSGIKWRD